MTRAQFAAARTHIVARRRAHIVALLEESPWTAGQIAALLDCSKSAIERDLAELAEVLPIGAAPDPNHKQRQIWRLA